MITEIGFRVPRTLSVTDVSIKNVLIIGSCLLNGYPDAMKKLWIDSEVDFIDSNNAVELPEMPPHPIEEYSFQIVQIATRSILMDSEYFDFKYDQTDRFIMLLNSVKDRLALAVDSILKYNKLNGITTFFFNFIVPQQNPLGRLLPKNDIRNFVYFFSELNRHLELLINNYSNVFILDIDEIASSLGKRYILDDSMWMLNHNAIYSDFDETLDKERIELIPSFKNKFSSKAYDFVLECLNEIYGCYKTILGLDKVKMIVTDLDDTLWRGTVGEFDFPNYTEGWTDGYAEALALLGQRGIILAVISKNEKDTVFSKWSSILSQSYFSVMKINRSDKTENMKEILSVVNLQPENVLFIDDNPVERENMRLAYPAIRCIGRDPHLMRWQLLWAPETQVVSITSESANRSEMVAGQLKRENLRSTLTREEFLSSLGLKVKMRNINDYKGASFKRAVELINKTNQFNTTGQRWKPEELRGFIDSGGRMYAFECTDKFTVYGIICIVLVANYRVVQMVLSCRVFGLGATAAILALLIGYEGWATRLVELDYQSTGRNQFSLDDLKSLGFKHLDSVLQVDSVSVSTIPSHIEIV